MSEKLKVLFVSTEVSPYAKSGGLGDVAGSLPKALRARGVDVRVIFPRYKTVREDLMPNLQYLDSFTVNLSWRRQSASIYSFDSDVPMYMLQNDYYFGRDGFYGYSDDYERFAFFSKATVEFLAKIDFRPDIIHFNDWQTGLGPVYLRDIYGGFLFFQNMKTLFTIHNLRYQGVFGREILWAVDLNDGYFTSGKLEFYDKVSYMKAGLTYSDAISTVSETYANEIKTGQYGYGMDGILRDRGDRLFGIVNGIDVGYQENDPATDPDIFENFTADTLSKKKDNKRQLQAYLNLPQIDAPMIAIISRLVDQKGLDLVAVAMSELMSMDIQLVVLGTGDGRYEHLFKHNAWHNPHKLSANILFDNKLAKRIYASADIFLMPSLFEPCGLGQIFAMRYGTVPIVRRTGGLVDTVSHFNEQTGAGTGFMFDDYVASGMMWAVKEALRVYYDKNNWEKIMRNGMLCDFSWDKSAGKYITLYEKLKNER
ncbi:MAG: glycogen synthase GlgA [Clostridiales bacterium]|jgi:starch synthase|nr:glycogen synthase GlgA [Clostridiales bacterium]